MCSQLREKYVLLVNFFLIFCVYYNVFFHNFDSYGIILPLHPSF